MKPQWGKQKIEWLDVSKGSVILQGEVVEDTTSQDYDIQAEIAEPNKDNLKLLAQFIGGKQ